ncbi:MAG TPA: thioredoxin domain-containing protein [Acidimicrobiales bacterium]|nr:thioredoxin domain-containing protein [Acidimicrobiales bacterium]
MPLIKDVPAKELSPYLRQHRDNPVDWFPWGDDAFDKARREDRPVFLSIGYSACHWCHVMAHESFEDPATADALNSSFVSIKVDREERPDVDAVYMEAVQAITGSGCWPMSMFLTPDRRPFFGGTYFPPEDRRGTPSFRTVLGALVDVWENRRAEVEEQADELASAVAGRSVLRAAPAATSLFSPTGTEAAGVGRPDLLTPAVEELSLRFDPEWGGFGTAPKFPQPALVDLVLLHSVRTRGEPAGERSERMATVTLDGMAAGGIHDHLGGGFARYSTDDRWLVPHFEKMLYDQAGLLRAFLHGWQATGRPNYRWAMESIVAYVSRDLTGPEGGVWSAEDADSEGVEGRFYLWSPEQVRRAVAEGRHSVPPPAVDEMAAAVIDWFGVTGSGDFEGGSILHRPVGQPLDGPPAVEAARSRLFEARESRVRPGLDDKVLTEWNAMYASALAEAAGATGNAEWADAAVAIGEFLCAHLLSEDGRWRRSWQPGGGARHLACAGDYAWLVDCFTRLGELTGEARWTDRAVAGADGLTVLFGDEQLGGFFTTGTDAETLIVRTKEVFDGATPSANAVAALALARLGSLTGIERYTRAARGVVDMFGGLLREHPTAFAHTVLAADLLVGGVTEVVISGDRPDLLEVVRDRWLPGAVLAWGEPTSSPLWHGRDGSRAYVCRDHACRHPAEDATTLALQLGVGAGSPEPGR